MTRKNIANKTRQWAFLPFVALFVACQGSGNKSDGTKGTTSDSIAAEHEYGTSITPQEPLSTTPTNKFAKIIGWKDEQKPKASAGYKVLKFADELNSPRNIYVAPNGDIFVAQARTERSGEDPEKVDSRNTFRSKSPNQIIRFIDRDKDGVPETKETFLTGLSQPYGMLVLDKYFYVANTDAVVRFPYDPHNGKVENKPEKLVTLPAGGYNNHWTRNIIANKDGSKIYISVGSAGNVGEDGMDKEIRRAGILEINPDGSGERIFASGLRNPVGMDWEPTTNTLWTAVNERDELGDELVPDYITSVKSGAFYGWPYTYWGNHVDPRWEGKVPDSLTNQSIKPDYAIGAHTASLGLAFSKTPGFEEGAYVGQHGSWNRSDFSGYKVLFIPFNSGKPNGKAIDFLTGFIADRTTGEVYGRPVEVAFTDKYMLVTDDAANVIWAVLPE